MSLAPGVRLGSYEIVSLLGSGGMGEVYRARDMRLKREVAVKTLPERSLADPESLARFQREGELLAALNHPNIAAIYGFEETGGTHAIVMELVEGPTLAERIAIGPLPITEVLTIARQMAEALEAAHERSVIHRDLKPANVKVTAEGHVKVLDFGLAKLAGPAEPTGYAVNTMSPTLSAHATMAGVLLGTAAYMSPEQARAKPLDKRTDIWSFGCVLYEMLTGKCAFDGEEITDVLARIIEREPDFGSLPATTPPTIRRLLRRCLEKDRRRRLPDIGVARLDIEEALTTPSNDATAESAVSSGTDGGLRRLPWAVAAGALLAAGMMLTLWAPWHMPPLSALQRLSVELGTDVSLLIDQGAAAVLSPDGQMLAFVAEQEVGTTSQLPASRLYVRRLDQLEPVALVGTDGARDPIFSPDGQWIAFFANGKLKKIATIGGAAVTLADAPNGRGAAWAGDDTIIFTPTATSGLLRVASAGGDPQPLTELGEGEVTHRWPQLLPGGNAILYTANNRTNNYEDATVVVQVLPAGARTILLRGAYYARHVPSGHLLYITEGTLFAVPFDVARLELTGQAVPALQGIATSLANAGAQFAVSDNGALVYVPGAASGQSLAPMFWMDRQGRTSPLRPAAADWSNPHWSPDGRSLAIDISDDRGAADATDVWVYDSMRDTLSRLTFDATADEKPVWTPDGRRIVFRSKRGDKTTFNLYWQRADGTGNVERLTQSTNNQFPTAWHPSGKFLSFVETTQNNALMILPIDGDQAAGWKPGKPTVFLDTSFVEQEGMFSPDGRWMAYASNESGRQEIYVRPFPGPGGKWQISTGGGNIPTWSPRGELVYRALDGRLMAAGYSAEGDSFRADKPRVLAETPTMLRPRQRSYAVHPDGERFVMAPDPLQTVIKHDRVVFVLNFFDELRRIAPPNGSND